MDGAASSDVRATTAPSLPPSFLFARNGKLELRLLELSSAHALARVEAMPPLGSAAVLSRNGARAIAMVEQAGHDTVSLAFDEPLTPWQLSTIGGVRGRG